MKKANRKQNLFKKPILKNKWSGTVLPLLFIRLIRRGNTVPV